MVGSSIIKHAFSAARNSPGGVDLSLSRLGVSVWWQGYSGLGLHGLLKKIAYLTKFAAAPHFIIIHCGGNDIGKIPLWELRTFLQEVFSGLVKLLPQARIIWSQILPRKTWRYSVDNVAMRKCRVRINSAAAKLVLHYEGAYFRHPDITDSPSLFANDGVHLSVIGNNIFLNTIQAGLEHLLMGGGPVYPL